MIGRDVGEGQMVLQQIRFSYEIDYYDVDLEMVVIHRILVLEKTSKKGLDDSAVLSRMFY